MVHQMARHRSTNRTATVHKSTPGFSILQFCFQHSFHSAEGAVGCGGAGINRAADRSQYMGCERCQTLHVLQAGVEVTAGDHGAVKRLQKLRGDADEFILDRIGFCGSSHDLAAGETGAVEVMLVSHQTCQALSVGDAGFIAWVVEQPQSAVGRAFCIGVFGHHEHRKMIGDVFGQH